MTRKGRWSIVLDGPHSMNSRFPRECSRSSFFREAQEPACLRNNLPSGNIFARTELRSFWDVFLIVSNRAKRDRQSPVNVRSRTSIAGIRSKVRFCRMVVPWFNLKPLGWQYIFWKTPWWCLLFRQVFGFLKYNRLLFAQLPPLQNPCRPLR